MFRFLSKSRFGAASNDQMRILAGRSIMALLVVLGLSLSPAKAMAACGSYGVAPIHAAVKLPPQLFADFDFPRFGEHPTIVGLWHVVYTNGVDQSIFNDTLDTWHADGTEFESAFLAPAGGDVCAGVYKQTQPGTYVNHHVGWLFNPSTPTANATNYFTLDEQVTVAENNKSYTGTYTFKIWNLDGTPTPVVVTGTMQGQRITAESKGL